MNTPRGDRDAIIARAMDTFPEAVRYLHALCADFDGLGTDVDAVLRLVRDSGVPAGRALDLGCGKGAHTVALCRDGWRVRAVDLHERFLAEARTRASNAGMGALCDIQNADLIHEAERTPAQSMDLTMLLAVGRPWGKLCATIEALRRSVRPGGLILFDDAFLDDAGAATPEYEGYAGRHETEQELIAHGDQIIDRWIPSVAESRAQHERELDWLRTRGEEIMATEPDSVEVIRRFLSMQEEAYEDLDGPARGATWLLQRSSG